MFASPVRPGGSWSRVAQGSWGRILRQIAPTGPCSAVRRQLRDRPPPAIIDHLRGNPDFKVVRHDVVAPLAAEVDEIYNLACPASPPDYQADPIHTMKTSVLGALNLLDLATAAWHPRSSKPPPRRSTAIRTFIRSPKSYWGNVNPIGPRSCYDEGKRCAETLFFDFHDRHGVEIKVGRIFNTYGPRMRPDDGRVVSNFIVQALEGRGHHDLWRRFADPFILLCRRPDRGLPAADGLAAVRHRPGQSRQSGRVHRPRTGRAGHRPHRLALRESSIDPLPVDDPRQRRPDISPRIARTGLAAERAARGRAGCRRSATSTACSPTKSHEYCGVGLMSARQGSRDRRRRLHRQPYRQAP